MERLVSDALKEIPGGDRVRVLERIVFSSMASGVGWGEILDAVEEVERRTGMRLTEVVRWGCRHRERQ